jgi:two-component system, LytTR family, sensor kinase
MSKRNRIIFHVTFWLVLLFSGDLLSFIGEKDFHFNSQRFSNRLYYSSWFFKILISYLILYVFNRFLPKKKYLNLVIGFFVVAAIYVALRYFLEEVLYFQWYGVHNYSDESLRFPFYITDNIYNVISYSFYAFFFKMIEDFFRNETEKRELLTEKLAAEQAFLKNQLSPHFLFNTLNNIYSLTLNQSPKAPEAVLKLSELMRYMIYESNNDLVSLSNEIKYLTSFIDLQKYRYPGQTYINFNVIGNPGKHQIAPLLLVSFVENAFKHGIANEQNKPLDIDLLLKDNFLNFTVVNYKNNTNADKIGGVGLKNVERRLALIYPEKHYLSTSEIDNKYTAELNIIL